MASKRATTGTTARTTAGTTAGTTTGARTSRKKATPVRTPPILTDEVSIDGDAVTRGAAAIDPQIRHQLVATEAYYLAERRGFAGGHELEDWVTAEALVDTRLHAGKVA